MRRIGQFRYRLLATALLSLLYCELCAEEASLAIEEMTIAQLQTEMASGRLTAKKLVEYFQARIEAMDRHGPQLNSVVEVNQEAIGIAEQLDQERRLWGMRSPLHGIPVLLKDNIDTADTMLTTAGSLALINSRPREDAFIVRRLRDAGAVIIGKTNLSEWANFRSTVSVSGWSARGGLTRNPYALDRNPCGSSSGSAVAIAAGFAVVAVGTETDGSIVCPAAINGIVGIKPTVGLVSRKGIIPISASQDTAGPMARTVADAATLLAVLTAVDPDDPATSAWATLPIPDYSAVLPQNGLKNVRIGVARNLAGFHEGIDAILEEAIANLTAVGAVIVDPANLQTSKRLAEDELAVLLYEFKDGLNRYLATRSSGPQTLAELIEFNKREREREMPYFGQQLFILAQEKGPLTERDYRRARARAKQAAGRDGIDALLRQHRLDAIIAPTVGLAWTTDLVNGDHVIGGDISQAPAVAGYPHITVPAGLLHGLPVGISFVGTARSEPTLLRLALAFEQITHGRRAPDFTRGTCSRSLVVAGEMP